LLPKQSLWLIGVKLGHELADLQQPKTRAMVSDSATTALESPFMNASLTPIDGFANDPARRPRPVDPQPTRKRMSALERREQLIRVGRTLFAQKGFESVTIEEIAHKADVSKPVVYEHFGRIELDGREVGAKEALYAVIVDREIAELLTTIQDALNASQPLAKLEAAALGMLSYIEDNSEGFSIIVRDSPVGMTSGSFSSLITDIAMRVQHLLASEFKRRKLNPKFAPLYAQALVGMVALTGQWWLETRKPSKEEVASHLVNLAWNGLGGMEAAPRLRTIPGKR
jgi:AcrR family transcriptional regulator